MLFLFKLSKMTQSIFIASVPTPKIELNRPAGEISVKDITETIRRQIGQGKIVAISQTIISTDERTIITFVVENV
jgi:hypothetical protein